MKWLDNAGTNQNCQKKAKQVGIGFFSGTVTFKMRCEC